jgi:hypothetical protein
MSPLPGFFASEIQGHTFQPQGSYDALGSVTLTASANTITFAGIPQGYQHLQLRMTAKNDQSAAGYGNSFVTASFNGDTAGGTNYRSQVVIGNGTNDTVYRYQDTTQYATVGMASWGNSTQTYIYAASIADILNYSSPTKQKTIRFKSGKNANGGGEFNIASSFWNSLAPITNIVLYNYATSLNFATNSTFALYGVK